MTVEVLKAWAERWVVPPVVVPFPGPPSAATPSDSRGVEGETLPSSGQGRGGESDHRPSISSSSADGAQSSIESADSPPSDDALVSAAAVAHAPPSPRRGVGHVWEDLIEGSLEVSPHLPLHRVVAVFLQSELCVCQGVCRTNITSDGEVT